MTIAPPAYLQLPRPGSQPFQLKLRVKSQGSGTLHNLSSAQLRLSFWSEDGSTMYASATATPVDASAGRVDFNLDATQAGAIPVDARFDLLLVNSLGRRRYLIYGDVIEPIGPVMEIFGGSASVTGDEIFGGSASATGDEIFGGGA